MSSAHRIRRVLRDLDQAREELGRVYRPHTLSILGSADRFAARHSECGFPGFSVYKLGYGSDVRATIDRIGAFMLVSEPLRGRYRISSREGQRTLGPGAVVALDPDTSYAMDFLDDCVMRQVRIDRGPFNRSLTDVFGIEDPEELRFSMTSLDDPVRLDAWRSVSRSAADLAASGAAAAHPLVASQLLRLCVATIVSALSPETTQAAGKAAPAALRRARDYIRANAADDISLADIAAAAGSNPRSLQKAFRSHLDTTPLGYLREIRFKRAHAELRTLSPRAGITVTDVAMKWGFFNLGRFAVEYRKRFQESPRTTLRC